MGKDSSVYKIGCGKADITGYVFDKGMMGYSMPFNVVTGVETPLYARAFWIQEKDSDAFVVLVVAEICFYSIALKHEIIKQLQARYPDWGISENNVVLSTQHTHSGPGGYSHYMLYNLSIPGFQPKVFDQIVQGTVAAIEEAHQSKRLGKIHFSAGAFDADEPVAFNRSLNAYNRNPEIKKKMLSSDWHLAVDREMKLLRFEGLDGVPIGSVNWFGVHTTSIGNENGRICSDNKGYAATYLENEAQSEYDSPNFIAAFAQDTAGDVSPNHIYDPQRGCTRGFHEDDFESAKHNGRIQFNKAKELFDRAIAEKAIEGGIDTAHEFIDMSNVEVDPEFVMGMQGKRTAPQATGVSMLEGTVEGPGMPKAIGFFAKGLSNGVKLYEKTLFKLFANRQMRKNIDLKYEAHGKKHIMMESNHGKLLGTYKVKKFFIPDFIDPFVHRIKVVDRKGLARRTPWMPNIVPIQIVSIGSLAIVALPCEVTTIAGKRLREGIQKVLKHKGIDKVMIGAYSNGYCGYTTTPEEYDKQRYEGSHTLYGKWTLPAYQTKFKKLCIEMLKPEQDRTLDKDTQPVIFAPEEIWYGEGVKF